MADNYPQSSHTNKAEKSSRFQKRREKSLPYHRPVDSRTTASRPVLGNDQRDITEEKICTHDNLKPMKSDLLFEDILEMQSLDLNEAFVDKQQAIRTEHSAEEMRRLLHLAKQYAIFFACCEVTVIANMHDRIGALPRDPTSRTLLLQRTRAASFLRRNVFRKGKLLGKGSFGKVYLTSTHYSPKLYALKIVSIKVPETTNKRIIYRFMTYQVLASRERDVMVTANHPFICKLKASWVERLHSKARLSYMFLMEYAPFGNLLYFILYKFHCLVPQEVHEFYDGEVVKRIKASQANESAKNKPANPYARRRLIYIYTAEMASALAYLHRLGIVHRDFKPCNVLIGEDYHLRVTDFGFTCSKKAHLSFALHQVAGTDHPALRENPLEGLNKRPERLSGTLIYCRTPEMISKQVIDTNIFFRMDMWSLGITLFELYGGLHPFAALTTAAALQNQEEVDAIISDFRDSRLLTGYIYSKIIDDEYYRALLSGLICELKDRLSSKQVLERLRNKVKEVVGTSIEELHKYRLDFMVDVLGRVEDKGTPAYNEAGWSPYSGVGSPHCEGATALAQIFPHLDSPKMSDQ